MIYEIDIQMEVDELKKPKVLISPLLMARSSKELKEYVATFSSASKRYLKTVDYRGKLSVELGLDEINLVLS